MKKSELRQIIREEIKNIKEVKYSVVDIIYQIKRSDKPKTSKLLTIKVINRLKELGKDRDMVDKLEKDYKQGKYIEL